MNLEDLQKQLDRLMHERNSQGLPQFEWYSPLEMHQILYSTFGPDSPLQFKKLKDSDIKSIPILNQIKYLTSLIYKNGEIKLTNKGFLPTKVVSELYYQGFIKDKLIESGISKLYKETDSMSINLTRILIELAGLAKKRNGKLSLTKTSEKLLADDNELLRLIFITFATKFNWAYYDGYGENNIGQIGYGFSLILLSNYGQLKRIDTFYADKYFRAFPHTLESMKSDYGNSHDYATGCYSLRTFERFLNYFGIINIEKEHKNFATKTYITKTDLFDKLIECITGRIIYSWQLAIG